MTNHNINDDRLASVLASAAIPPDVMKRRNIAQYGSVKKIMNKADNLCRDVAMQRLYTR